MNKISQKLSAAQIAVREEILLKSIYGERAVVSCYKESSLGANVQRRFEQGFYRLYMDGVGDEHLATSFGYFQILGCNLTAVELAKAVANEWLLEEQIIAFDRFFTLKLKQSKNDLFGAYRLYNGDNVYAYRYAGECLWLLETHQLTA